MEKTHIYRLRVVVELFARRNGNSPWPSSRHEACKHTLLGLLLSCLLATDARWLTHESGAANDDGECCLVC